MVHPPCVLLRPEVIQIADSARVDSFCKIEGGNGVRLGEYVHIASFSHLNVGGGSLIFEDHSGCSSHVCVGSGTPDWGYPIISAAAPPEQHHVFHYTTRICAYVVLFMGVIVVPGVEVAEGTVVLPGSVVLEDTKPWSIYQGNPAKRIGERKLKPHEDYFNLRI